jgi:hypothetical protein
MKEGLYFLLKYGKHQNIVFQNAYNLEGRIRVRISKKQILKT